MAKLFCSGSTENILLMFKIFSSVQVCNELSVFEYDANAQGQDLKFDAFEDESANTEAEELSKCLSKGGMEGRQRGLDET